MALRKYLTEFIGTFFLVLTIGLVVVGDETSKPFLLAPLAIGAVLMAMVYMGGFSSGAHYNPAVSLAVLIRGKMSVVDFIVYVVVQLIASVVAAAVVCFLLNGKTFPIHVHPGTPWPRALAAEFIFTFALALVVLNVATAPKNAGNSFYGLAIGFVVTGGAVAVGGISGGAFNPSVGTGPTLFDFFHGGGSATLSDLWIYWVGPLAGGLVAGLVSNFQNCADDRAAKST